MVEEKELEIEQIRNLALRALKNFRDKKSESGGLQSVTLIIETAREAVKQGLKSDPESSRYDIAFSSKEHDRTREVVSNFLAEGILMWGLDRNNAAPPWMGITEYGMKVLEEEEIVPHDMHGFLSKFKKEVPQSNDLIIKYLIESLHTYRHNNLLSSSVMLGVASEAAFNELFSELKKSLSNPDRIRKFEKLEKSTSLKDKFDETTKEIDKIKPLLDGKLREDIEFHVKGIFELIRNQRNDSGHPTGKDVSRDDMLINLRLFITFCNNLYNLVEWLKQNPSWEKKLTPNP